MKKHKCKFKLNWSGGMINTREIAEEYRMGHWTQIMRERSESGLSITAYCKSIGIHPNRYFYWQRKLREAAHMKEAAQNKTTGIIELTNARERNINNPPQGWAICEKATPEPEQQAIQIEIGKNRITVQVGTDQLFLEKVCRTLMSLC